MASRSRHYIAVLFGITATVLLDGCNLDGSSGSGSAAVDTGGTTSSASSNGEQNTSVTLSWAPPQTNADGSALTNLAGYHIHYGTQPTALNSEIDVPTAGLADYVVEGLKTNSTYYFAISSYNSEGIESADSAVIDVTT